MVNFFGRQRLPQRHLCGTAPIKMCRHGRHTFVFHAPEGRASYTAGVLHALKACFICGALRRKKAPRRALFILTLPSSTAPRHRTRAASPLRHAPIKMCRHGRHTFVFHAPEGRASYTAGVLHALKACFICGALRRKKAPRRALFILTLPSSTAPRHRTRAASPAWNQGTC